MNHEYVYKPERGAANYHNIIAAIRIQHKL